MHNTKIIWVLEDINQNIVACVHIKLYMHAFVNSWLSRTIHDIVINKKKFVSKWQSMLGYKECNFSIAKEECEKKNFN